MFGAHSDRAAGIPVTNEVYHSGEKGIAGQSLPMMCRKIREGAPTAVMKSFAGNVLKEYGFPNGVYQRTVSLLDFVRKHVAYAPDMLGTEQIQSAAITLCVAGAPVCIPVGDCDDLVVALGTLIAALGMEIRVTRQIFGGDHQQHVLLEVKDEKGKWLAADPSSKTMPVGRKAPAVNETYCSPWDSDVTGLPDEAQFVGIGALPYAPLPVLMLTHGAWRQVNHLPQPQHRMGLGAVLAEIAPGIEVDMQTGEVQVAGLGHGDACCSSCAQGKKCEGGCSGDAADPMQAVYDSFDRAAGLGGLMDDTMAALRLSADPADAAKKIWAGVQGKTWDGAIGAADARAESRVWDTGLQAQADLATLALSSACNVRGLDKIDSAEAKRVSDALTRTFYILLKRIGRAPSGGASVQQYTSSNLTAGAEIPIGIVIVLAIAAAVIYVAFFAFIYYVLRDCLSIAATSYTCDREMLRLHSEVDKIVDNHLKDGKGYSVDELRRIAELEAAQKRVLEGCIEALKPPTPPKPPWDIDWSTVGIVAGIVGVTALGVIYAPEIKRLVRGNE
jgi:hypothetical protein